MLFREDGAVLLQHRDDKPDLRASGKWVPPGGHRELGETIEECARREFLEETGYFCGTLEHSSTVTVLNDFDEGWPTQVVTVFRGSYDGVQSIRCFEGQELRFISREDTVTREMPCYILTVWDEMLDGE